MKKILSWVSIAALASCSPQVKLKGVKAARAAVESTVSTITSGTVDAQQQAVLGFGTTGRVTRLMVRLGDKVRAGQILAELENTDLRTTATDAAAEVGRTEQLFKEGLVAKSALDDARRAHETAKSNYEKSVIRAPFDGLIAELNLQVGELSQTNPAKSPLRVVDMKPRIVKGEIDEADLSKVRVDAEARIKILAVRPKPFTGAVTKVIPYIGTTREQDRSAQIELKFTEPTDFVPVGASADIEIVVAAKGDALAVPSRALLGSGNNRHLFVFKDGKLHKRPIKLGVGNYDRNEILDGVSEGEVVVFPSDEIELKDGQKANVEVSPWP